MKPTRFLWVMTLLLPVGCTPLNNVARTVFIEPAHYWEDFAEVAEKIRYRKMAKETLARIRAETGDVGQLANEDFGDGFVAGYSAYIFAGGTGAPPPLPPRRYWKSRLETPEGHDAVNNWFQGYHLGTSTAREQGLRQWVAVPSSVVQAGTGYLEESPEFPPRPTREPTKNQVPVASKSQVKR